MFAESDRDSQSQTETSGTESVISLDLIHEDGSEEVLERQDDERFKMCIKLLWGHENEGSLYENPPQPEFLFQYQGKRMEMRKSLSFVSIQTLINFSEKEEDRTGKTVFELFALSMFV